MKKMYLEIEVEDDFIPGDCRDCPLFIEEYGTTVFDDDGYAEDIDGLEYCVMQYKDCKLKQVQQIAN